MPKTKSLASSLSLTLALGFAFTPEGCGGATPVAEVPGGVAWQLEACAVAHQHHLGSAELAVRFDVELSSDGQVDSVALRDATFSDRELELCMASAVQSLSEEDLPVRRSEARPREAVAPESRALFAQSHAAMACLASPPCVLTLGFLMGASYLTVVLYVRATSTHRPPVAKPQLRQPPTPTQAPPPAGDPSTTGPTPPLPPAPPDCPRNESFAPIKTDNATGCTDKKGNLRCYSRKHAPCAGVHTHGILSYQEIRNGVCKEVRPKAVRCEGPFKISGPCGSVSTVECGDGGLEISGTFEDR